MSASPLISRNPKRAYIIAPSVKQKEELLKSIDRYCSLYYITMGSAYNIAQTAMIDAYNAIKEDKKLYRQQTKQSIKRLLLLTTHGMRRCALSSPTAISFGLTYPMRRKRN